ncbi:putative MFS-type transporter YxlH [Sporosarcina sp. NCCP-2331]|nr:putative MFS-type transporter YxlH [Sporosarcina sp. NCCP-2331]GLB55971.1 putative MFS-type transporter YxlH [Sporosarcina sp. NCCP-2378]
MEKINFSYTAIGLILGSYGLTQVLFRLPLGILSDRLVNFRKHMLIAGFISAFLSGLLLVFFDSFYIVLLARLMAGINASMWVMATVLYSDYFNKEQASKGMGTMQFNTVITQFFCVAISGYLIHLFGWKFPFLLGAVFSVFGMYFCLRIQEVKSVQAETVGLPFFSYFQRTHMIRGLKAITFLSLIAHALLFITIFGFSVILADTFGMTETQYIWLMSAFFLPHACISLLLVFLNLKPNTTYVLLFISFAASALFILLIANSSSLTELLLYHSGLGLSLGYAFPVLLSEVVRISPAELKMSAMGYYQSFYAIGIFVGPLLAGYAAEAIGLANMFRVTALITLLSAFVLINRGRDQRASSADGNV